MRCAANARRALRPDTPAGAERSCDTRRSERYHVSTIGTQEGVRAEARTVELRAVAQLARAAARSPYRPAAALRRTRRRCSTLRAATCPQQAAASPHHPGKDILDVGITHPTIDSSINHLPSEVRYAATKDRRANATIKAKGLDISFLAITFGSNPIPLPQAIFPRRPA